MMAAKRLSYRDALIAKNPTCVRKFDKPSARRFGLTDRMTFGKHKGETVSSVIEHSPNYLLWCRKNIDWFDLDDAALYRAQIEGAVESENKMQVMNAWAWGVLPGKGPYFGPGRKNYSGYSGPTDDDDDEDGSGAGFSEDDFRHDP